VQHAGRPPSGEQDQPGQQLDPEQHLEHGQQAPVEPGWRRAGDEQADAEQEQHPPAGHDHEAFEVWNLAMTAFRVASRVAVVEPARS
jgi:hypothetical protein